MTRDEDSAAEPSRGAVAESKGSLSVRRLSSQVLLAARSQPFADLLFVFGALPTVLVGVFFLPGTASWQLSLAAESVFESRRVLWTAFASSFVHTTTDHLFDNVFNYWLVVVVAYPLSIIAGWRRRFFVMVAVYLAIVPFISAWATIVALGGVTNAPTAGFSDVNSALLGYLIVVWFAAVETDMRRDPLTGESRRPAVDPRWAAVVAFGSLAVVYLVPSGAGYFPPIPTVGALFAVVAVGIAAVLYALVGRPVLRAAAIAPERELLYVAAASVAVAGVIGSLVLVPFGSNVFAHLAGYAVGFALPFLTVIANE